MHVPPETGLDVAAGTVRLGGKYVKANWIKRRGSHDNLGRTPTPSCQWGIIRKRGSREANPRARSKRNLKASSQRQRDEAAEILRATQPRPNERPSDYRNRLRLEAERRGY